ncbi:hypothetical protein M514_09370 [Trichuris suis]|uniref:Uncharacterized protein n=1 Tax=Trichuris suis TaxID=68888 RepID=A0A085NGC6_9BILA|nr:hypothetical protein M514_09370 [Trichuris suis]
MNAVADTVSRMETNCVDHAADDSMNFEEMATAQEKAVIFEDFETHSFLYNCSVVSGVRESSLPYTADDGTRAVPKRTELTALHSSTSPSMMLLIFQLHDQTRASCKALNIISNSACIHQTNRMDRMYITQEFTI